MLYFLPFVIHSVLGIGQWLKLTYSGAQISTRYSHAGAYCPATNEYILFGGSQYGSATMLNDLYAIDMSTLTATQITSNGPAVRYMMAHTSILVSDSLLFIHGKLIIRIVVLIL